MSQVKVKGAILRARRAFVTQEFGQGGWQRVLAGLSEEDRATLEGLVLASAWIPFALNERLDRAIVATVGDGDPKIFEQLGARSAQENLSGPHRSFLKPGDPQRFMALAEEIYSHYYDTGHRVYEPTGANSGVLTTYDAETFSETDCRTVMGWYQEALKMCGVQTVHIREESCRARGDAFCRYRVSWEM